MLDILYILVALLAAPWVVYRRWRVGKRVGGLSTKLTGHVTATIRRSLSPIPDSHQRIWLHAVSVGEVLLLQPIISELKRRYPGTDIYLSVTTATGREVAEKTYPDLNIVWFPFDFSWAVRRALTQIKPSLILLAELELWPNFITMARAMNIPVVVVNGRISQRSYEGYRKARWLISRLLNKIDRFAVQHSEYGERLKLLGMKEERIVVTGSVKFDGVTAHRHDARVQHLRTLFGLNDLSLVWVVGSTQAPEEAWALDIFREAKSRHPNLVLILVPRHQERFNEVAELLIKSGLPFQRRSEFSTQDSGPRTASNSGLILIDTLGELRAVWGLADVGFVGGSFNDRGGQNMIEPAAYGVAVTFGPNTWNFKQTVRLLLEQNAAIEVKSKEEWQEITLRLLADVQERQALGERARQLVLTQQGATERTMELLESYLLMSGISEPTRKVA